MTRPIRSTSPALDARRGPERPRRVTLKLPYQLPTDLIMDLIAIARMLYARELQSGGNPVTLQEIADVGRSLKTALQLAKGSPGTLGMENAWHRADQASQELGRLLGDDRAFPPPASRRGPDAQGSPRPLVLYGPSE